MADAVLQRSSETREQILAAGQRIMASKGFSGVGLNEVLASAGVPKGSFYHYFASKDAFGEALLRSYFDAYVAEMDRTFRQPGQTMAQRLTAYWRKWQDSQSTTECSGKCLAVKLGAEVADMSEPMRMAMKDGTDAIVARLAKAIEIGAAEGSLAHVGDPAPVALGLYELWLGASVMAKVVRSGAPFASAFLTTRQILRLPA